MLEVKNLSFKHKSQKKEILKKISLTANPGEITTILGPNGAGKSTLFKCITGIWKNYEGEILINGKKIDQLSFRKRAKFFSVVPQEHEPPFPYTVFEVVLMGRASYVGLFSSPKKEDYQKAEEALEVVKIFHLKDIPYTKISGGERQLTLIARALTQDAPVMILDEPTSHLDFRNQLLILKTIKQIVKKRKLTAVLTLHDPNLASLFSDKIIIIKKGQVIHTGYPEEVITEEILKKVYEVEVEIVKYNGANLVIPKVER